MGEAEKSTFIKGVKFLRKKLSYKVIFIRRNVSETRFFFVFFLTKIQFSFTYAYVQVLFSRRNKVCECFCLHFAEVAKVNDEKFKKMKDIYQKLREEHVNLLRSVS